MSRGRGHIPIRTCISCNTKRDKKDLFRLILDVDGRVIRDTGGKGADRGAYVCKDECCLGTLKPSQRLRRAFRTEGPVTVHPDLLVLSTMPEAVN